MFLTLLAGCAKNPQLTRDDWLQLTSRTYQDITPEQALIVAEEIFKLSDSDDYTFSYPDEKTLIATRTWFAYLIIAAANGTNVWEVSAEPVENGHTKVRIYLTTNAGTLVGMATPNGGANTASNTTVGVPNQENRPYEVFWRRFDYLVGLRDTWLSCGQVTQELPKPKYFGQNEAFCDGLTQKDKTPEGPLF